MALDIDSSYRLLGSDDVWVLEVDGASAADCYARAIEALASRAEEPHPSVVGEPQPLTTQGLTPADVLQHLLAMSGELAAGGQLAIGLDAHEDHLAVEVVPVPALQLAEVAALIWHDVVLREGADGRWRGRASAARAARAAGR